MDSEIGETALVKASMGVVKGAFRFATGVFGKPRAERDVGIKFGTATAGVRGTEPWGRSPSTRTIWCVRWKAASA